MNLEWFTTIGMVISYFIGIWVGQYSERRKHKEEAK